MFIKIVAGALAIVATLWAFGYDAATIEAAAKRWSNSNSSTVSPGSSDWGSDTP